MKRPRTLAEAIECAAEHLPDGWQIEIRVENGWAGVTAHRPNTSTVDIEGCDDESILSLFFEAMQLAKDETESDKLSAQSANAEVSGGRPRPFAAPTGSRPE